MFIKMLRVNKQILRDFRYSIVISMASCKRKQANHKQGFQEKVTASFAKSKKPDRRQRCHFPYRDVIY